jgi:methyl-accepting chemotaxis protein
LELRHTISDTAIQSNQAFAYISQSATSLNKLAQSLFDVDEYINNAQDYFDNQIRPIMDLYVINMINNSDIITGAYFAIDPNLAGFPLVNEVFFELTDSGIEAMEPQSYDEYMAIDDDEMQWFYGPYLSGYPYWSEIYTWIDGTVMVSYTEPVTIDGRIIGVVGVDIQINHIEALVRYVELYDTGFKLMIDSFGNFFESNDFIRQLNNNQRDSILNAIYDSDHYVFEMSLNGITYYVAYSILDNDYIVMLMVPKSEVNAESNASLIRFIIIFIVVFSIVLFVAFLIGRNISKPIHALSSYMRRVGLTGNVLYSPEENVELEFYINKGGEMGRLIESCGIFIDHVIEVTKALEQIADGDLSIDVEAISDQDVIANTLNMMLKNLNDMFNEIGVSAKQVSAVSNQIASGSHALAQGSTEQAASVEELSGTISDIAGKIRENADMAKHAAALAETIKGSAEEGSQYMDNMMTAVDEIAEASNSIEKVIKVIDDIAFQTNILALNAAVEAARAGSHGKGFAVVAEEVRNLASKSADAARNTNKLIAQSIEKASLGSRVAGETASSLEKIVSGINESSQIVNEIAKSSEEQSNNIGQINTGIDQVSQVVQQNSATAEQSSAASSQMNGQSVLLNELISKFRLKNSDSGTKRLPGN